MKKNRTPGTTHWVTATKGRGTVSGPQRLKSTAEGTNGQSSMSHGWPNCQFIPKPSGVLRCNPALSTKSNHAPNRYGPCTYSSLGTTIAWRSGGQGTKKPGSKVLQTCRSWNSCEAAFLVLTDHLLYQLRAIGCAYLHNVSFTIVWHSCV